MQPSLPSAAQLRYFGCILLVVFGVVGAVVSWQLSTAVGRGLWATGIILAATYYLAPPLRVGMFLGWMALIAPLGLVLNKLVLGLIYFGALTPIALLMRPFRSDKLTRRFDREAPSHWQQHDPAAEPARYFRQS